MNGRMASDWKVEVPVHQIEEMLPDYKRRIRLLLGILGKEQISPQEREAASATIQWLKRKLDAKT